MDETNSEWVCICVYATMKPLRRRGVLKEQVETKMVTKTKWIFKKSEFEVEEPVYEERVEWVPTGEYSDVGIDMEDFADSIRDSCLKMDREGFEAVQMIPIDSGRYRWDYREASWSYNPNAQVEHINGGGFGFGYGYPVTDGLIIIGKKAR